MYCSSVYVKPYSGILKNLRFLIIVSLPMLIFLSRYEATLYYLFRYQAPNILNAIRLGSDTYGLNILRFTKFKSPIGRHFFSGNTQLQRLNMILHFLAKFLSYFSILNPMFLILYFNQLYIP
jgi:hypothetical protein